MADASTSEGSRGRTVRRTKPFWESKPKKLVAKPNKARPGFDDNRTVFGAILRGELPAKVFYEDARVLAFADIAPACANHILIIPKKHITRVSALTPDDLALLRHMVEVAARACGGDLAEMRRAGTLALGFHHPFITVSHLHLHVVWPLPARSCLDRLKFPESGANATSCFFMTPEDASERYCRAPLIEPA